MMIATLIYLLILRSNWFDEYKKKGNIGRTRSHRFKDYSYDRIAEKVYLLRIEYIRYMEVEQVEYANIR